MQDLLSLSLRKARKAVARTPMTLIELVACRKLYDSSASMYRFVSELAYARLKPSPLLGALEPVKSNWSPKPAKSLKRFQKTFFLELELTDERADAGKVLDRLITWTGEDATAEKCLYAYLAAWSAGKRTRQFYAWLMLEIFEDSSAMDKLRSERGEAQEERKKGTDEVHDATSETSDQSHGGDGNSGEVNGPSESDAEKPREPNGNQPAQGGGEESQTTANPGDGSGEESGDGSAHASQEKDDKDGEQPEGEAPQKSKASGGQPHGKPQDDMPENTCDYCHAAKTMAEALPDSGSRKVKSPQKVSGDPLSEILGSDLARIAMSKMRKSGTASRVKDILARIVRQHAYSEFSKETPRFDGKKVVREVLSKRCSVPKMRGKKASDIKPVLLLVDVSGSCSAYSAEFTALAVNVAKQNRGLFAVCAHINGGADNILMPSGEIKKLVPEKGKDRDCATIADISIDEYSLIIQIGDWDAGSELLKLSQKCRQLLWLDNFCSRLKGVQKSKDHKESLKAKGFPNHVVKIDGVGSGEQFIEALRMFNGRI